MKSLLIEFHRFGAQGTGLLRKGDRYLVAAASHRVREREMPLSNYRFLDLLRALRYEAGKAQTVPALNKISDIVTHLLRIKALKEIDVGDDPLQLDLVVNAAELASLPFEAALDGQGRPLVARTDRQIMITRRVRGDFAETAPSWPAKPRILFAWACPQLLFRPVPFKEHAQALQEALSPWGGGPSGASSDVLTVLPKASLQSITRACQDSVAQGATPFTHVHLLAHGCPIDEGPKQRFGLALHAAGKDDLEAVTPGELVRALTPLANRNVILTLTACDSANEANAAIPKRSIAHALHVSGFPVVIASQLPLTIPGSTVVVKNFYSAVLAGEDVRCALHQARCALFQNQDARHDWASLVGYVRLPEGYADFLKMVRLESQLASLKAIQSQSDQLTKGEVIDPAEFQRLVALLLARIRSLEGFLNDKEKAPQGALEENLGLLGSAAKRLAETYFSCGRRAGEADWDASMRGALKQSCTWYQKAFEGNLSHHWTGVQFLSLEAVVAGQISDAAPWYAAVLAARLDSEKSQEEVWAFGSLAELYLLAGAVGQCDHTAKAADALNELKRRLKGKSNQFPLESTRRQLQRYVNWWTKGNQFFPGQNDLSLEAANLVDLLQGS